MISFRKLFRRGIRSRVVENADPEKWREHLFGLPAERWQRLSGRAFWITGAGTGYGRSIACALAAAGAQVFLTGRWEEKLKESIEEMRSLGISAERCFIVRADITDPEQINDACEMIKNLCESLYGLINNAALPETLPKPLQEGSLEYWNKLMSTNVTAQWLLTKTIFPHMLKSGEVKVLFMSSGAGWAGTSGYGMYNISKAALNNLGMSMAEEYASSYPDADIQMNVVVPGEARTEMNQGSSVSPYSIVSIILLLLSHPKGGPNGRFFHRDGSHLQFCSAEPYEQQLI